MRSSRSKSAINVPVIVAINFSSAPFTANTCASHTVIVRPGFTTPPKTKLLTSRRGEEVSLELDREYVCIIRHKRKGRVAACIVEGGRYDTGVYETMMLCVGFGVGHH
ncbi:MAG: hypothetical protein LUO89_01150 [Methanothrix sp.]|nr:hypothetical protein [Methanothrix sp.]